MAFRDVSTYAGATWLVMQRDLCDIVRARADRGTVATLVLARDGDAIAGRLGATPVESMRSALEEAALRPAGGRVPERPAAVHCPPALRGCLAETLSLLGWPGVATRDEEPGEAAEDIFDTVIASLVGRPVPADAPTPLAWQVLHEQALRIAQRRLWLRWPCDTVFRLRVESAALKAIFDAVVLGSEGAQRGLMLGPPDCFAGAPCPERMPMPLGAIAVLLDREGEGVPPHMAARARRYGWPAGEELLPTFVCLAQEGPSDLDHACARMLTITAAAVLEHDGQSLSRPAMEETTGTVPLPGGGTASFSIWIPHRSSGAGAPDVLVDVLPDDARLGVKVLPQHEYDAIVGDDSPMLSRFPAYVDVGGLVPTVLLDVSGRHGRAVVDRLARMRVLGVERAERPDGVVYAVASEEGMVPLRVVDSADLGMLQFEERRARLSGAHALVVADVRGDGAVFGVFECVMLPRPGRLA